MSDWDELEGRLDELEQAFGVNSGPKTIIAFPSGSSDSVDEDIFITEQFEVGKDGEYGEHQYIAIPNYRPRSAEVGSVQCLTYEEIEALWHRMPDDIRERELESRLESGEPIPPILQQ